MEGPSDAGTDGGMDLMTVGPPEGAAEIVLLGEREGLSVGSIDG